MYLHGGSRRGDDIEKLREPGWGLPALLEKKKSFPFIVVLLINGSETSPLFGEVQRGMRLRHTAHTVRVSHIECQSKGVRDEIGCPIGREDPEPI